MSKKKWIGYSMLVTGLFVGSCYVAFEVTKKEEVSRVEQAVEDKEPEQAPVTSERSLRTEQQMAKLFEEQNWSKVILHYKNMFLSNTTNDEPTEQAVDYYNEALLQYFTALTKEQYYYYRDYESLDFERIEPEILQYIEKRVKEDFGHMQPKEEAQPEVEQPVVEEVHVDRPQPSAREVYNYAQRLFDVYTNNGENYIAEIHDPRVMREVAAYYQITVEQADRLYVEGMY